MAVNALVRPYPAAKCLRDICYRCPMFVTRKRTIHGNGTG